jgi:hypothetical protein
MIPIEREYIYATILILFWIEFIVCLTRYIYGETLLSALFWFGSRRQYRNGYPIKGAKGDPGTPGLNGKDGRDGSNGRDGVDGAEGPPGSPGQIGERGPLGTGSSGTLPPSENPVFNTEPTFTVITEPMDDTNEALLKFAEDYKAGLLVIIEQQRLVEDVIGNIDGVKALDELQANIQEMNVIVVWEIGTTKVNLLATSRVQS